MAARRRRSPSDLATARRAVVEGRAGDVEALATRHRFDARAAGDPAAEAASLEILGLLASSRGDRAEALARYRELRARRAEKRGAPPDAEARLFLGGVCHDLGYLDEAEVHLDGVRAEATKRRDPVLELKALTLLAALQVEREAWDAAWPVLLLATDMAKVLEQRERLAYLMLCRGWLTELRSGLAEAEGHYAEALGIARRGSSPSLVALGASCVAHARAFGGAGRTIVSRRMREASVSAENRIPNVGPSVALRGWACAYHQGDLPREELVARLGRLGRLERAELQSETRTTLACLERLLAREPSPDSAEPATRVAADGTWFEVSEGQRVSIERRRALARVLAELARAGARGASSPWAELLAAGWPDERVSADAGFARVRSAVWALRKLGLERHLVHDPDGGYRLVGCAFTRAEGAPRASSR